MIITIIAIVLIALFTYVGSGLYMIGKEQERVGHMLDNLDNPTFYMLDYKGKHFILADEVDEDNIEVGTMGYRDIISDKDWLMGHIEDCEHYGIPPYTGQNADLISLISRLENEKAI